MKNMIKVMAAVILITLSAGCSAATPSKPSKPTQESKTLSQKNTDKTSETMPENNTNSNLQTGTYGLLLGFAGPIENKENEEEDPAPAKQYYKSIWIAPNGSSFKYLEKDGLVVAPGADGFYIYKNEITAKKKEYKETEDDSKPEFYDLQINKLLSYKAGEKSISPEIDIGENYLCYYNESDNLVFAGNNYSIIYTSTVYTSGAGGYQFIPSIDMIKHGKMIKSRMEKGFDPKKDTGIFLKGLFDLKTRKSIDDQINELKEKFDKKVKDESDDDKQYISEKDLTLCRKDGKWRLFVPLEFSNWKESHNWFKDYEEINCTLPETLVSYDELCKPYSEIKKVMPDIKDAVSSPDKKILAVQTNNKLLIYMNPLDNIKDPVLEIALKKDDGLVLNQWCTGKYIQKWDEELSGLLQ